MSGASLQRQPVADAAIWAADPAGRVAWRRRAIAGPAGLALLLAGGGMLIRVALLTFGSGVSQAGAVLYTAIACILAGVALLLIALPKIVGPDGRTDEDPSPEEV